MIEHVFQAQQRLREAQKQLKELEAKQPETQGTPTEYYNQVTQELWQHYGVPLQELQKKLSELKESLQK